MDVSEHIHVLETVAADVGGFSLEKGVSVFQFLDTAENINDLTLCISVGSTSVHQSLLSLLTAEIAVRHLADISAVVEDPNIFHRLTSILKQIQRRVVRTEALMEIMARQKPCPS